MKKMILLLSMVITAIIAFSCTKIPEGNSIHENLVKSTQNTGDKAFLVINIDKNEASALNALGMNPLDMTSELKIEGIPDHTSYFIPKPSDEKILLHKASIDIKDPRLHKCIVNLTINDDSLTISIDNVPLRKGKTTCIDHLHLTSDVTFNISIDPSFDGEETYTPENL